VFSAPAVLADAFFSNAWENRLPGNEAPAPAAAPQAKGDDTPAAAPAKPVPSVSSLQTDDLWERIRSGFALPELDTPLVKNHEEWYANPRHAESVRRSMERSRRYLYYIVGEVEKRGMPMEIALLPMIESSFNPKAYSPADASGIWQFIPSTGRHFGLKHDFWGDDRQDITAATQAALDYLQKLYGMFGDWNLALAAYNWGEGAVARAIAKNQRAGLPTDYTSLSMPAETRNYVPRLLAVKHMVMDPAAFGVSLVAIPNRPYFTSVTLAQNIDVKLTTQLADVPMDEFISLNPSLNKPVIRAKGARTVLLPADKADAFLDRLESYDKPLVSWGPYFPKAGEPLEKIAHRFGLSLAELKSVNDLGAREKRASGRPLLVPAGDRLQLAAANDGTPDSSSAQNADAPAAAPEATPTRTAKADAPVQRQEAAPPATRKAALAYRVRKGDSLASIARRFDVSTSDLRRWNHLDSDRLALRQQLVIENSGVAQEESSGKRVKVVLAARPTAKQAKSAPKATQYVVRKGDTLGSIARKFNVGVDDITRWNKVSARHLKPGTKMLLYASNAANG
jgi:membrane-bound lytic murein transglycosylase D